MFISASYGILDIFLDNHIQEYVFIVLKSGEVVIWSFLKPTYKWNHLSVVLLCKGKGSQLVHCVYDNNAKLFVWCEKRSASQCCICTARVTYSEDDDIVVTRTRALLHNCLPMNIYLLSDSMFCFVPVLNKPPGLLLFWSVKTDALKVSVVVICLCCFIWTPLIKTIVFTLCCVYLVLKFYKNTKILLVI